MNAANEAKDKRESAHKGAGAPADTRFRITTKSAWSGAWKKAAVVGGVGLAAAAYGYKADPARFAFSYLFGFLVWLSLALGSLFFVMILYVTKAGWGVTVRRTAEMFMRPMATFAILVIPLVLMLHQLFPWEGATPPAVLEHRHSEAAAKQAALAEHAGQAKPASPVEEERGLAAREPFAMRDMPLANAKRMERAEERAENDIVNHKRLYLNRKFFLGRLIAYLLVWSWLAQRYFRWSTEQDKTKAVENTRAAQSFAPAALILFGFSLSYFAIDWILSLDATWYSTMWGVTFFAQCALFQMATLIVTTLALRRSGLLGDTVNVEHYHDMGKLLFGWVVFWSYVTFAQFFLTWYANIPDELGFFHLRWHDNGGTWKGLSLFIVAFHFFVPFWFLLSRNIKRRLPLLSAGAMLMVIMEVVEVYWIVMPNFGRLNLSWIDAACLAGVGGVYLATVLRGMEDYALVPVGDPRLARGLEFENA